MEDEKLAELCKIYAEMSNKDIILAAARYFEQAERCQEASPCSLQKCQDIS